MAAPAPERAPVTPSWRDLLALGALAALVLSVLALRPPVGSDMRYEEAAWEMAHGGSWLVPTLCGVPYFEKPILIYWLGALSQRCFGSSPLACQLPSVLSAVASVLIVYSWGRWWRGARFGVWAALLLLGTGLFVAMGSILTTDPLLALTILAATACFARHEADPAGAWIWGFWIAAGLGGLTKGPIAWVLIGCGIAPYLALSRPPRLALAGVVGMRPLRGLLVLAAINLPWWIAVWRIDPRYVEFFFVRINLQGLVDPNVNHPGPPWFYLGILAGGLMPVGILLLPALGVRLVQVLRTALHSWTWRGAAVAPLPQHELLLGCMALGPLAFLSASASKLPAYVLPLVPMFVLLGAAALEDRLAQGEGRWMRLPFVVLAVLTPVAAIIGMHHLPVASLAPITMPVLLLAGVALILALAGIGLAAIAALHGRLRAALAWLAGGTIAAAILLGPFITQLRMRENAEPLAAFVATHGGPHDQVIVTTALAQNYEIVERLHRPIAILGPARELGMGHFTTTTPRQRILPLDPDDISGERLPQDPLLWSAERLRLRWRSGERLWLFAEPGDEARLRQQCLAVTEAGRTRKAVLLTNHPLGPPSAAGPPAVSAR